MSTETIIRCDACHIRLIVRVGAEVVWRARDSNGHEVDLCNTCMKHALDTPIDPSVQYAEGEVQGEH